MPDRLTTRPEFYDEHDSDNVCYLCENPRYTPLYHVTHYDFPLTFQECACGMVKQTPMPNGQFFEWFFNSEVFFSSRESDKDSIWGYYDYFADEPNRLATSQWRYRKLSHLFQNGPLNVMKIGPGTGTFLYVAQQHGHNALGCDISDQFAQFAREKYNVQIDQGRFEQQHYEDEQFDVLMLFNVIENVPNQVEFLEAIHRTVKPGGYFVLNFVDMRNNLIASLQKSKYFLYRPPVCYTYTLPVMKRALEKFGFRVVETYRDVRTMNVEKIVTLLGWRWALHLTRTLKINRLSFRIYAYPSKILVTRRM
jgi:ubiquinone/menaquinone biosynthesis C-methylase UbiE